MITAIYITFTITGVMEFTTPNEMYTLMTSPSEWSGTSMIALLNSTLTAVGAGLVIVGTILPGKHDLVVFGGISVVLLSFGVALKELYTLLAVDAAILFPSGGAMIATLFITPLIVIFFMTVISFWRGRSD